MLDLDQPGRLIAQLKEADAGKPIDPAWPLAVERARRSTEATFRSIEQRHGADNTEMIDLVGEGLGALMRLIRNS
jgi:hypothetical protein